MWGRKGGVLERSQRRGGGSVDDWLGAIMHATGAKLRVRLSDHGTDELGAFRSAGQEDGDQIQGHL